MTDQVKGLLNKDQKPKYGYFILVLLISCFALAAFFRESLVFPDFGKYVYLSSSNDQDHWDDYLVRESTVEKFNSKLGRKYVRGESCLEALANMMLLSDAPLNYKNWKKYKSNAYEFKTCNINKSDYLNFYTYARDLYKVKLRKDKVYSSQFYSKDIQKFIDKKLNEINRIQHREDPASYSQKTFDQKLKEYVNLHPEMGVTRFKFPIKLVILILKDSYSLSSELDPYVW